MRASRSFRKRIQFRLLIGDAIGVALFVGSPRIGRGLLDQLAQIVFDDLDAPINVCECCLVNHAVCLDWSLYRERTPITRHLFPANISMPSTAAAQFFGAFYCAFASVARGGIRLQLNAVTLSQRSPVRSVSVIKYEQARRSLRTGIQRSTGRRR
jgi:hypothetical protein